MCVCVYVCMCVCVYVCMQVYTYIRMQVCMLVLTITTIHSSILLSLVPEQNMFVMLHGYV